MKNWENEVDKTVKIYGRRKFRIRNENKRRKAINEKNIAFYKQAQNRWENSYYCHRDSSVFIPGEGTWAPVSELKEYLYKK